MRICLICVEIFAWGKYGGFGRATRILGRELAKQGFKVFAVVPRRSGQKPIEDLDGITVLGFPSSLPWTARELFKQCDADVYHSCEPSFGTYLALKAMPDRKHLVTCRDPRSLSDWKIEFDLPSLNKLQVLQNYVYENNILVKSSVRKVNAVYAACQDLIPMVKKLYSLNFDPKFLPTPVSVPERIDKSTTPIVCYLGRLDRRKRPTLFLELAKRYPDIQFIAMGKSRDENWETHLRKSCTEIPNLEVMGFVDQFSSQRHSEVLEKSWIVVNTSSREGLPNAFLEAAAHQCALLSSVNPDGFAKNFGYHAYDDNFGKGLELLLRNQEWRVRGLSGYEFVRETYELNRALDLHIEAYTS